MPPSRAHGHLSANQALTLSTRGQLAVRAPAWQEAPRGAIRWVLGPPDLTRTDLTWYTDGSFFDVSLGFPAAGCAMVAVDPAGDLVAAAMVTLSRKTLSAHHAEWVMAAFLLFPLRTCTAPRANVFPRIWAIVFSL